MEQIYKFSWSEYPFKVFFLWVIVYLVYRVLLDKERHRFLKKNYLFGYCIFHIILFGIAIIPIKKLLEFNAHINLLKENAYSLYKGRVKTISTNYNSVIVFEEGFRLFTDLNNTPCYHNANMRWRLPFEENEVVLIKYVHIEESFGLPGYDCILEIHREIR